MEEVSFLSEGSMVVTSSRIDLQGQTFATRNVSSVKVVEKPFNLLDALLLIVGIFSVLLQHWWVAIISLLFGIGSVYQKRTNSSLVLTTSGGEVVALQGRKALIERVRVAVAQAISSR